MKVWKFDKYVSRLDSSIESVEKAISEGALLTDMEMFDFQFKQMLAGYGYSYLKGMRDKLYRTARYAARSFEAIFRMRKEGYTNSEAKDLIGNICGDAVTGKLVTGYRVKSFDENGVLYFELYNRGELVHTFDVTGVGELTTTAVALVTFMLVESTENLELKDFFEKYSSTFYREVMSGTKPTPYVYEGKAKTLRSYMNKKRVTLDPEGKVVQFKVG